VGQPGRRAAQLAIYLSGETATRGLPHLHINLRALVAMLPAIEAALGHPRSGWGPEMQPMGIPIRDPSLPCNYARWPYWTRGLPEPSLTRFA